MRERERESVSVHVHAGMWGGKVISEGAFWFLLDSEVPAGAAGCGKAQGSENMSARSGQADLSVSRKQSWQ